ncbi:serpin family protein [uncultured Paraglaciecola sp.]|uniref:serpin family protein n=1 Tax=uncultured Paraglaciecola sp. TaxID=1765024 RepID=UPI0025DF6E24|nr:serpin family protein [uncultured Paraglaciecola sp.]
MKKTIVYLAIALQVVACGTGDTPETKTVSESFSNTPENDVVTNTSFSTPAVRSSQLANQQDTDKWKDQVNLFSFESFQSGSASKNFLSSPYNELSLFALTSAAANNNSLSEINEYFGYLNPTGFTEQQQFFRVFNTLEQNLTLSASNSKQSFQSVNTMWGQQTYAFSAEFLAQSATYFGTELFSIDTDKDLQLFSDSYIQQLAKVTGEFLPSETDSFIRPNDSVLLISNMSFLETSWKTPFDPQQTKLGEFKLLDQSIIDVPLMHIELDTHYYTDDKGTFITLPSSDPEWSFFLYSAHDIDEHRANKNNMTLEQLNHMKSNSYLTQVKISMPSFSIALKATGLDSSMEIFDKDNADISNLSANAQRDLYANIYNGQSLLVINEQGIKIAGESFVNLKQKPLPVFVEQNSSYGLFITNNVNTDFLIFLIEEEVIVEFNHPFIYFVFHNPTGTLMYSGNLVDPTKD